MLGPLLGTGLPGHVGSRRLRGLRARISCSPVKHPGLAAVPEGARLWPGRVLLRLIIIPEVVPTWVVKMQRKDLGLPEGCQASTDSMKIQ